MAYLRQDKRTYKWFVVYRWNDAQHNKSCGTTSRKDAAVICSRVEDTECRFRVIALMYEECLCCNLQSDPANVVQQNNQIGRSDNLAEKSDRDSHYDDAIDLILDIFQAVNLSVVPVT